MILVSVLLGRRKRPEESPVPELTQQLREQAAHLQDLTKRFQRDVRSVYAPRER